MFQSLVCDAKEKHQINKTTISRLHYLFIFNFEVMRGFCDVYGSFDIKCVFLCAQALLGMQCDQETKPR